MGSERAPIKPFRRALDRLEGLQAERRSLDARRGEIESGLGERARLSDDLARLERELSRARHVTAGARLRDAAQKIATLQEIQDETDSIRRLIVESGADAEFPAHRLEELNALHGARESIELRLNEIREETDHVLSRARQREEEMRPLGDYGALYSNGEAERISEWFHRYLALSLQRDDAQRSLQSLQTEITARKSLAEVGAVREVLVEGPSRASNGELMGRAQQERVVERALAVGEIVHDENGEKVEYEEVPGFWKRLSVRPGLTGITTIYKPKDISPHKKFRYDLLYVRNQSFWLDLRLIIMSFWISFRGKWETRGKKV